MTLIRNGLVALSPEHLGLCINTLGSVGGNRTRIYRAHLFCIDSDVRF